MHWIISLNASNFWVRARITPSNKIFSKRNVWNLRHNITVETTNFSLLLYLKCTDCCFRIWKWTQRQLEDHLIGIWKNNKNMAANSESWREQGRKVEFCFLGVRDRDGFRNKSLWASTWQKRKRVLGEEVKGPCVKGNMPRLVACVEEKRGEEERDELELRKSGVSARPVEAALRRSASGRADGIIIPPISLASLWWVGLLRSGVLPGYRQGSPAGLTLDEGDHRVLCSVLWRGWTLMLLILSAIQQELLTKRNQYWMFGNLVLLPLLSKAGLSFQSPLTTPSHTVLS